MHILVMGGSGRIGKLVIDEAIKRGHTITALVRDESKLEKKEGLILVKGDPKVPSDLSPAFTPTPDAVITALAARRQTDSPFSQPSAESPPRLMADIQANLVQQIRNSAPTKKLVVLSMAGCGDSRDGLPMVTKLFFAWSPMRHQLVDHDLVDTETRKAREASKKDGGDFDFTLVRPVMFSDGDATEVKVWPESGSGVGLTSKITRKSVAAFMVDAAEKEEWNGKAPVISN
ncbi:hypothetical protein MKZ38_006265 [Zalerion maritima]|uniref:NAD(P)-binding domain-containing protein n=1 Tax=Zalerion maritima TaxID=339359 RepID=A0AAD5WNJ2_9PEZI|nr:hypothetical protein MKZ38_006265 [Zalerion maritima]